MNNAIAVPGQSRLPTMEASKPGFLAMNQLEALKMMGEMLVDSGMFGLSNPEQGFVIAMTCQMEGITPLQFIRKYHIIQKKPSMRTDAMLAEFLTMGGKHEIVDLNPDRVTVRLCPPGTNTWYDFTVTWEQMQKEPWPWVDKNDPKKGLKDSWSTPLQRQTMLFNRLISDRIRKLCPQINAGIYTPEELQDMVSVMSEPTATLAPEKLAQLLPADPVKQDLAELEQVLNEPQVCTSEQADKIYELFNALGTSSAKRAKTFESYGHTTVFELSSLQASELIGRLETALAKKKS